MLLPAPYSCVCCFITVYLLYNLTPFELINVVLSTCVSTFCMFVPLKPAEGLYMTRVKTDIRVRTATPNLTSLLPFYI